jgi:cytochrome c oxidase subunit 2
VFGRLVKIKALSAKLADFRNTRRAKSMQKMNHSLLRTFMLSVGGLLLVLLAVPAGASYDVNIAPPATPISEQIYGLHMYILWICAAIFVIVFGAMFYSIFKFRKSKGAKPDVNFHESTLIEIIWTIIPFFILIAIAVPATRTILDMKDTSNPDMTIKVTGFQWGWRYDYSADEMGFYSNLSTPWSQIGQPGIPATEKKGDDYLLEVDNPLVVPIGKRVRLLVTSNDVIHGWYVPQLGVNQYGIPGFIKDVWFKAEKVGTFKGQCSQICGKLHGYMPITVIVKSAADYAKWLDDAKGKWGNKPVVAAAPVAPAEDLARKYTMAELKSQGEKVYAANCVACHQPNGKGMPPAFPALAGSKTVLAAADQQINVVLNGRPGTPMQSFAQLSNTDLASVITFTKNSFGNNTGTIVQPADVKAARK